MEEETQPKNNTSGVNGWMIATIVLALLLSGVTGYIIYDKFFATDEPECDDGLQLIMYGDGKASCKKVDADDKKDGDDSLSYNPHFMGEAHEDDSHLFFELGGAQNGESTLVEPNYPKQTSLDFDQFDFKSYNVTLAKGVEYYGLPASNDTLKDTVSFEQPVRKVLAYGRGQAVDNEVVVFVMGDGSVQYIPVQKSLKAGKILLEKLDGVSDVVDAEAGGVRDVWEVTENGELGGSGWVDIFLKRLDGGYYYLSSFLGFSE